MQTIWKYELAIKDHQKFNMPCGAKPLCVQMQHGNPCLWMLVNDNVDTEDKWFITHGTGHETSEKIGKYIGSYQMNQGTLVFHVFESL